MFYFFIKTVNWTFWCTILEIKKKYEYKGQTENVTERVQFRPLAPRVSRSSVVTQEPAGLDSAHTTTTTTHSATSRRYIRILYTMRVIVVSRNRRHQALRINPRKCTFVRPPLSLAAAGPPILSLSRVLVVVGRSKDTHTHTHRAEKFAIN